MFPFYLSSIVSVVLFPLFLVVPAAADDWTSLLGNSTVSAKLVGVWNNRALLKLDNGRQISVKLDDLNANSRIQAQNQQEEIDRVLRERVQELDAIAAEASAPAPAVLRTPSPPSPYTPPRDSDDLLTALNHFQQQAKSGHMRIYYDSLPKSFQTQADGLYKTLLGKLDVNAWELYRSTSYRLADVVVTRQRWLLSHPRLASLDDSSKQSLLTVASLVREVGNEELMSYDKLKASSLDERLSKLDDIIAPYLAELIRNHSMVAGLLFPSYQTEMGDGGKMIAKVVVPVVGTIQSVSMIQIEGRWIEGASADDAQAKWSQHKKMLESIPDGSLRLAGEADEVMQVFSRHLDSLERATTRNAFHLAMDGAMVDLAPMVNRWAGISVQPNYGDYDPSMEGMNEFESP